MDLLALSTGLFASAYMLDTTKSSQPTPVNHTAYAWLFLIAIIGSTIISLCLNDLRSPWHAWRMILYITAAWLVYRFAKQQAASLISNQQWTIMLIIIAHLYVLYAIIEFSGLVIYSESALFPIWNDILDRFPGPLAQPNLQSLFLCLALIPVMMQWGKKGDLTWLFVSIIPLTGLLLSGSRGGLIVWVSIFTFLLISHPQKKAFLKDSFIIFCIALVLSLYVSQSGSTTELLRLENANSNARIFIWEMGVQLFSQHPWLGIGLGNFPAFGVDGTVLVLNANPESINPLSEGHAFAHNLILHFALEAGIMGMFAILWLYYHITQHMFTSVFHPSATCLAHTHAIIACGAILMHGMVSVSAVQPYFMVLFALYFAAIKRTGKTT